VFDVGGSRIGFMQQQGLTQALQSLRLPCNVSTATPIQRVMLMQQLATLCMMSDIKAKLAVSALGSQMQQQDLTPVLQSPRHSVSTPVDIHAC
jgi:hypothetical protein